MSRPMHLHLADIEMRALCSHDDPHVRAAARLACDALDAQAAAHRAHDRGSPDPREALRLEQAWVAAASARRFYRAELEDLLSRTERG